ncbi:hypothetical protein Anas_09703 [Armadillidium nasatum]|uniref:Uncharacterized protein n=1 Tax=Armadillidium nasatum TaxID=96803 RepID=A0A5N5SL31_9CRUS|nr:hypothetical protein Anas_09703 [Armadillidium nasatum]
MFYKIVIYATSQCFKPIRDSKVAAKDSEEQIKKGTKRSAEAQSPKWYLNDFNMKRKTCSILVINI